MSVHREIMSTYRVDGIFINRRDGSDMCVTVEDCVTSSAEIRIWVLMVPSIIDHEGVAIDP